MKSIVKCVRIEYTVLDTVNVEMQKLWDSNICKVLFSFFENSLTKLYPREETLKTWIGRTFIRLEEVKKLVKGCLEIINPIKI